MILQSTSLESLVTENRTLRKEIATLKEQLNWFNRQIFGKKSEKFIDTPAEQMILEGFEGEPQKVDKQEIAAHTRKKSSAYRRASFKFSKRPPGRI